MQNSTKDFKNTNGIIIKDDISLSAKKSYKINKLLLLFIISFMGVIGSNYSFLSLFDFKYDSFLVSFYSFLFYISISVILVLPSKFKLIFIPIIIAYSYLLYKNINLFIEGIKHCINIIARETKIISPYSLYYKVSDEYLQEDCITVFFIFISFIIILGVCYGTIVKPNLAIVFAVTFPLVEIGLYFGIVPGYIPFFILISFWISIFAMQISSGKYNIQDEKYDANFIRIDNNFYSVSNIKLKVTEYIGIIVFAFSLTILIISFLALSLFNYKKPEKINEIRNDFKTSVSDFSVEKALDSLSELAKPSQDSAKLGKFNELKYKNNIDMTVNISENLNQYIYLKGFCGSVYTGDSWDAISDEIYNENEFIFKEFNELGLYPQEYNAYFAKSNLLLKPVNIAINSPKNRNGYIYYPYGTIVNDTEPIYDSTLNFNNTKKYSLSFYPLDYKENLWTYYNNLNTKINNDNYTNFVKLFYTQLPESEDMSLLKEKYANLINKGLNYETIDEILNTLRSTATYSLSPGKTPIGDDFVSYFLTKNKKGYCSHFASAAVVLCRIANIPARYVEGYVITPDDFSDNNFKNNSYEIPIKDSRSHAWAEIYVENLGWIPFEFTPGYENNEIPTENTSTETTTTPIATSTTTVTSIVTEQQTNTNVTTVPSSEIVTVLETSISEKPVIHDENSKSSDKINKAQKMSSPFLKTLFVLFLILLSITLIIYLRYYIIKRRRRISFNSENKNRNIINVYNYILKLLIMDEIINNNMTPLEFAVYVEQTSTNFNKNDFIQSTEIMLKAEYSNHISDIDEYNIIFKIYKNYISKIYNNIKPFKKLYYKYILVID